MAFIKCSGGGGWKNPIIGYGTGSSSTNTTVNLGFRPSFLIISSLYNNTYCYGLCLYDSNISTTTYIDGIAYATHELPHKSSYARLYSIDNNGFTITSWTNHNNFTFRYFAVKNAY